PGQHRAALRRSSAARLVKARIFGLRGCGRTLVTRDGACLVGRLLTQCIGLLRNTMSNFWRVTPGVIALRLKIGLLNMANEKSFNGTLLTPRAWVQRLIGCIKRSWPKTSLMTVMRLWPRISRMLLRNVLVLVM